MSNFIRSEVYRILSEIFLKEYITNNEVYLKDYLSMSEEQRKYYLPHEYHYFFDNFLDEEEIDFQAPREVVQSNYVDEPDEEVDMFDSTIELMTWLENNDRETYKAFADYLYNKIDKNELPIPESEYPAWSYFDDNPVVIKNQWLIHFTDNATDVALEGFKYGVEEMDKLGLTTQLGEFDKKYGGYNFAYLLSDFQKYGSSSYGNWTKSGYKYGKEAVIFRASGVKVWHHSDEEPQVIFYGNTATNIIPITEGDDKKWSIRNRNNRILFESDELESVVSWLVKNYDQYRKSLSENLSENIIPENISDKVWYHGTPDVREIEKEGGFTEKFLNIEYVDDIDGWENFQKELKLRRESGDENGYFELLNKGPEFRKKIKIKKPVFLTDVYSVAKSYANKPAFDYQNSVDKVLKVAVNDGRGVTINAPGHRFRFIDIEPVKRGFINAGVDPIELDLIIRKLNFAMGVGKGIRTDDIAAIGDWFGFDYIDVVGVLDSYEGGNTKSTVRMVFNPSDIKIMDNLGEVRSIVRSVLRESIIKETTVASFDAYHGSDHLISKFEDSFLAGERVTQYHGAGIYFTTNLDNAKMFGNNVYKVKIDGRFIDRKTPASKVDIKEIIALMKMSDDEWELEAQNYDIDPDKGILISAKSALNYGKNQYDAFMRVQTSWYPYDPLGFVRNMTKLGYDGLIVDAPSDFVGDKHIIVFNPEAVTIVEKVR